MEKFLKVIHFIIQTPENYVPADHFNKIYYDRENCPGLACINIYKAFGNVSKPLQPNTFYCMEIYKALEDVSASNDVDKFLKEKNAIKSGSQALVLAFFQNKSLLPIGDYIVSPEDFEILPDENGYKRHMGLIRFNQEEYGFDNGEAGGIRKGGYLMITKAA